MGIWGKVEQYILLSLSLLSGMVDNRETNLGHATLYQRDMTWATSCGINEHPLTDELENYLRWKKEHSKPGRLGDYRLAGVIIVSAIVLLEPALNTDFLRFLLDMRKFHLK